MACVHPCGAPAQHADAQSTSVPKWGKITGLATGILGLGLLAWRRPSLKVSLPAGAALATLAGVCAIALRQKDAEQAPSRKILTATSEQTVGQVITLLQAEEHLDLVNLGALDARGAELEPLLRALGSHPSLDLIVWNDPPLSLPNDWEDLDTYFSLAKDWEDLDTYLGRCAEFYPDRMGCDTFEEAQTLLPKMTQMRLVAVERELPGDLEAFLNALPLDTLDDLWVDVDTFNQTLHSHPTASQQKILHAITRLHLDFAPPALLDSLPNLRLIDIGHHCDPDILAKVDQRLTDNPSLKLSWNNAQQAVYRALPNGADTPAYRVGCAALRHWVHRPNHEHLEQVIQALHRAPHLQRISLFAKADGTLTPQIADLLKNSAVACHQLTLPANLPQADVRRLIRELKPALLRIEGDWKHGSPTGDYVEDGRAFRRRRPGEPLSPLKLRGNLDEGAIALALEEDPARPIDWTGVWVHNILRQEIQAARVKSTSYQLSQRAIKNWSFLEEDLPNFNAIVDALNGAPHLDTLTLRHDVDDGQAAKLSTFLKAHPNVTFHCTVNHLLLNPFKQS